MPEPKPLPVEQVRQHEAYMKEVIDARAETTQRNKDLLTFLFHSPGGSTLMTVLIGGLLATWINGCIQQHITDREARQQRSNAEHALELEMLKENLKQRTASLQAMLELLGDILSASDSLVSTYGPDFEERGQDEAAKARSKRLAQQIEKIRTSWNSAAKKWNSQRDKVGTLFILYTGNDADVRAAWTQLRAKVNEFIQRTQEDPRKPGITEKQLWQEFAMQADHIQELADQLQEAIDKVPAWRSRPRGPFTPPMSALHEVQ